MIIFPIFGAGGNLTRPVESAASGSIYLGVVSESEASGAASVKSRRESSAGAGGAVSGRVEARAALRVEVGTRREETARASAEAGTLQEAASAGAGAVSGPIERTAGASLVAALRGEPSASGGSLAVGGEAAPLAASATILLRSIAPARAPRAAFTLVVSASRSFRASIQISKAFELHARASAMLGRLQETPTGGAVDVRAGEGFTIAVDVLDAILATGRGHLC